MKRRFLLAFFGMVLSASCLMAQQKAISGKVTATNGEAMGSVTVVVKGTTRSVKTKADGSYTIQAAPGETLIFKSIGSSEQSQIVGTGASYNIVLNNSEAAIDEVVVTAMGIKREKKSLGYSAQLIKGDDVSNTQRSNFLNSLQGRVAGATITPTNGTPGASSQMIIRGAVSLDGDNQPLFVVDGLPISNRTFSEYNLVQSNNSTYNRNQDYGNRAMDINPEEIESITILKGPEASALYGTDGASGAVVITTKRAKSGLSKVSYSNNFRVDNVYKFPEYQTVYGPGSASVAGYLDETVRTYFGAVYPEGTKFYNNLETFYQTGFSQKHNATVEGGTEALSLRTTASYDNQKGTVPNTGFEQLNLKVSGSSKISSKVNMISSLNYITNNTDKTYKGAGSPMISVLSWPITVPVEDYLTDAGARRLIGSSYTAELDNPYWGANKNVNTDKNNRILGNMGIDYKASDWLSFSGRAGLDIYSQQGISAYHPQSYSGYSYGGTLHTFTANSKLFNGSLIATLKKDFGAFKPILRLGSNIDDSRYEVSSLYGQKYYIENYYSMNNVDPSSQRSLYTDELKRKLGYFANAELGYGDFLYLTLTGRYDKSSTLPKKNQGFFYPATSLSFVFSELAPFKQLSWLNMGKLRGSWGQSGKDARVAYVTGTKLIAQTTTGGGFATDVTAGNPELKAEFTTAKEVGFEVNAFKNRLSIDFSYYETLSDKQITAPRLSYGTGAVLKYINGGKLEYKGFELLIKGTPVVKENFSWDISANFGRNKGKILSLPADLNTFYVSDTWLFGNLRTQYYVGSSVGAFGAYSFMKNENGDILINPANGMPIKTTNFALLGDRTPDISVGLTNSFTYKNFNLSFLLDMRKGGDIFNATEMYLYQRGLSMRTLDRETPRVIKGVLRDGMENTANPTLNNIVITPYENPAYYDTYAVESDFIEKDINWLRLKDVTLAYEFPKSLFANSKSFKSLGVFVTGTDLLLFTNYTGTDPQVNSLSAASGGIGGTGIDYGSVGMPRSFNFGVKVGF